MTFKWFNSFGRRNDQFMGGKLPTCCVSKIRGDGIQTNEKNLFCHFPHLNVKLLWWPYFLKISWYKPGKYSKVKSHKTNSVNSSKIIP